MGKADEKVKLSLKGQSSTSWSAKKDAINPLKKQFSDVLQVYKDIKNDADMNAETVSGAKDIISQIDFKLLCLLDHWSQILTLIDRENRSL